MDNRYNFNLKKIASSLFGFLFITLVTCCMGMKHGMKTDMTNRGEGIVWLKHDHFSPGIITIKVNASVTWINKDFWAHSVISDAVLFDSKKIKHKESYSYKFTEKGIYNYHCSIHDKMAGKVIVE